MPACPSCQKDVTYSVLDNWFACPICNHWLRLRTNELGSNWLERGEFRDGHIHPVRSLRAAAQANPEGTEGSIQTLQSVVSQPTSPSGGKGWVFWFSTVLTGTAFLLFINGFHLELDSAAKWIVTGIAIGVGLITYIAVQIGG
jgi:hypothetical protein